MKIRLLAGDITRFHGDAIVNAANNLGLGGGGVDGAIHRAAGPRLLEACKALPLYPERGYGPGLVPVEEIRVRDGSAVPTPGFDLPCRWVLHTAGPVWPADEDAMCYDVNCTSLAGMQLKVGAVETRAGDRARRLLRSCYKMPMLTAVGMGLTSIAYPAISTGVYRCPMDVCAEVALGFCRDYRDWPIDVTFYLAPPEHLPLWEATADSLGLPLG